MTRVVVLPADESACGYYRMRLPAGAVQLAEPDWTVEVYRPSEVLLGVGPDGGLWSVKGIPDPDTIDLIVMQRVANQAQVDLLKWFQGRGTAIVLDVDDAMWCIEPENSAYQSWNSDTHNWRFLDAAAALADIVTVTTPYLAQRYGKRGHGVVLPNCVPRDLEANLPFIRESLDQTPTIGWAGFTSTHPGDLTVVGNAVKQVVADTSCLVRVVGDAEGAARDWGVDSVDPVEPTKIGLPYYTALTTMDIGLVPLLPNRFNNGKSYLKALEYAACGVAVVASPTPANQELRKSLGIAIAKSEEDWYAHITRYIHNPDWREELVQTAKQNVYRHHTYEVNAHHWVDAWNRAINRRRRFNA